MLQIAPLMHGAAQWSTFHMIAVGSKVVLPADTARLDWPAILRTVEREKALGLLFVGDAMARPMLEEIQRGDYDLSGLVALSNGGAPLTPAVRSRVLEALPHIMLLDMVGSSEAGVQVNQVSTAGAEAEAAVFNADVGATVLDPDLTRELSPGEGEGWLARAGHVPLGYLGDEAKTAGTFPVIGGTRYSVPGDRAELLADGRIRLLGRDNTTINSGGEKIFAEEVERALAAHPGVRDVIVVPRPSEKWGSEVTAIVALDPGQPVSDEELLAECGRHLARYKVPKAIIRRPEILRSPTGKPDYRWGNGGSRGGG
jgi:fatty-acyl-CoA synthase